MEEIEAADERKEQASAEEEAEEAEALEDSEGTPGQVRWARRPNFLDHLWGREPPRIVVTTRPAVGKSRTSLPVNSTALVGFILGVLSVFLYETGILPILGVVFSTIGLATFKPEANRNRWMGVVGLVLSIIYTFMFLYAAATRHGRL